MNKLGLIVLAVACGSAAADVRLPAVLGSNMVLQQQADVPLWGWDKPGQTITVTASWTDKPVTGVADERGHWLLSVHTPQAGAGAYALTITGSSTVRLDNVLVGEVWLCSGQSNMEMAVGDLGGGYRGVRDSAHELAEANYGGIRMFDMANIVAAEPQDDGAGAWAVCTPERTRTFSATAYFFGRELHKTLNVPIGLISADWGGTVCEAWTSEPGLAPFPEFKADVDFVRSQRGHPPDAPDAWTQAMKPWWEQVAQKDPGSAEHWESPGLDDSGWALMEVPALWGGDLAGFDGIVWMRKDIVVGPEWAGKPLDLGLGPIDDMDTTYFDGSKVGGREVPGFHDKARSYTIPAEFVTPGVHTLAVRILDTGGPGGVGGDLSQNWVRPTGSNDSLPLSGYWKYRVGANLSELPAMHAPRTLNANTPTALYNGMIAPIIPYAIRGAIWYQGESNRGRADQYARLFPAMIADWRHHWGRGDFPFYYVQIAPFGYGEQHNETALLREAQFKAMATPNTGMAVTMDIGNPADIHPNNKQDVGRRLSLWALANTYGRHIEFSGPLVKAMKVGEGNIRVTFDHSDGLNSRGGPIKGFQIAGADRQFVDAVATIDGDRVIVSSDRVPTPVAVRYGWGEAIAPNLFNGVNLPAAPFRTDDWPQ